MKKTRNEIKKYQIKVLAMGFTTLLCVNGIIILFSLNSMATLFALSVATIMISVIMAYWLGRSVGYLDRAKEEVI